MEHTQIIHGNNEELHTKCDHGKPRTQFGGPMLSCDNGIEKGFRETSPEYVDQMDIGFSWLGEI